MDTLAVVVGWLLAVFLGGVVIILLYLMISGKIDLTQLISEPLKPGDPPAAHGDASMSRFQLLVFTFVIAMSLFLIVVANKAVPDVPTSIVGLLGVSGGSYVISKGIQANRDVSLNKLSSNSGGDGSQPQAPPTPPTGATPN